MASYPCKIRYLDDRDPFSGQDSSMLEPLRPLFHTFLMELPLNIQLSSVHRILQAPQRLEDSTLQICRFAQSQAEFGAYLDLDSSLQEQWEDLEVSSEQENNIILRTKLIVRVKAIIEKLLNSTGRELRRALFSLKQIFQDDKDLVHEFVNNGGLDCFVSVGLRSDQNMQNYILRALGQIMLYVDGMAGVIDHPDTLRWLYSLLTSKFRLVTKTALKLLLVFVEYVETNALVLVQAVHTHHATSPSSGKPWSYIMSILNHDAGGTELAIYAMNLLNKTLSAIPDQDTFYDVTDSLEEMGMHDVTRSYLAKKNGDPELLEQFHLYEATLCYEDGEEYDLSNLAEGSQEILRQKKRITRSQFLETQAGFSLLSSMNALPTSRMSAATMDRTSKRRSKRYTSVECLDLQNPDPKFLNVLSNSDQLHRTASDHTLSPGHIESTGLSDTCTLRDKEAVNKIGDKPFFSVPDTQIDISLPLASQLDSRASRPIIIERYVPSTISIDRGSVLQDETSSGHVKLDEAPNTDDDPGSVRGEAVTVADSPTAGSVRGKVEALGKPTPKAESTLSNGTVPQQSGLVKSLAERHASITDKTEEPVKPSLPRERSGMISSAKERFEAGPAVKPPAAPVSKASTEQAPAAHVEVESTVDAFWERCVERVKRRPLQLRDFDFTDLEADETTATADSRSSIKSSIQGAPGQLVPPTPPTLGGIPPPPPPSISGIPPPPPAPISGVRPPPAPISGVPPPPPHIGGIPPPPPSVGGILPPPNIGHETPVTGPALNLPPAPGTELPKSKKTIKIHWTEWKPSQKDLKLIADAKKSQTDKMDSGSTAKGIGSRYCAQLANRSKDPKEKPKDIKKSTIWAELVTVKLDPEVLEDCFEIRVTELKVKKADTGLKKIEVLDPKRSNAINIGMKVLPSPRAISTAILKMDPSIINREGIEKLLTSMLPTEEECEAILKAKAEQDGLPLGQAEQFLITLSEITHLKPRLELWLFKLDYEMVEKEIADPLADFRQGINEVINCRTLRYVLSTVLALGNFLNGSGFWGFTLDYLSRLPEVKDTKTKNSLLYHVCSVVLDQFPDSTDIHSDLGALCRCHRVDWNELPEKLKKLERDSKQAWQHYQLIFNTDREKQRNAKLYEFITDSMERIACLELVFQRLMVRFRSMLEYVGYSSGRANAMTVDNFCRIMSEFALEYRTTREKIVESRVKKARARERKRTTGKLIVDVAGLRGTPNKAQAQDDEVLRGLLSQPNGETDSDVSSIMGALNRRRGATPARRLGLRGKSPNVGGELSDVSTDGLLSEQDALLDACLQAASDSQSAGSQSGQARRTTPRERRRPAVNSRVSIRRTITRKLAEEEVRALERIFKSTTASTAL